MESCAIDALQHTYPESFQALRIAVGGALMVVGLAVVRSRLGKVGEKVRGCAQFEF